MLAVPSDARGSDPECFTAEVVCGAKEFNGLLVRYVCNVGVRVGDACTIEHRVKPVTCG